MSYIAGLFVGALLFRTDGWRAVRICAGAVLIIIMAKAVLFSRSFEYLTQNEVDQARPTHQAR